MALPSASAITEYLSAMATMLLAMRRNDINIRNRWHYIFYVLHLMENALPTAITNQSGRVQVQVTHKQQILNHDIHRDHVVKIMAFAGTARPLLPTSCHSCVFTENKLDIELVLLLAFSELSLEGTLSLSVQLSL
ncbi:F-box DNA helicase 1-like isoform X2 [Salvelinus namaycush]|uniref:F-box DNA helicase 1-like isoform X2 n=1 Tax=Salvelinus namaycush TaxID=8040 RepID=A0A8U0PZR5_SALNM|nr:F-box DNA helicase 1-like isoform X2 [Salvelinus namaycush]